ncbi:MAG TPA: TonB-dependent receptor plug domain-containing protein, partial [Vicinamibacterales bacterium]|nr:TonB-dependent receptor plug domain-containing protein [Vicinamibacterales bacterium]
MSGTVVDETGGVVPGVVVAIRSLETGLRREVTTSEEGTFVFPLLQPARYVLSATLQGFTPIEVPDIDLKPNQQQALTVRLKLASIGENVVVTAQKRGEERVRDVPIPVTVLNADSLVDNGQVLLRDYYSDVPGLNLSTGLYAMTTLTIRGANSGGGDPTVGVIIDDVPFGSSTGYGTWIPDFDPGDLTQVEVLRGPQGALYGANSMGGLLKYVTKDPSTQSIDGSVDVGTMAVYNGDKPGYNLRGSVNVPLNDALAMR